jgi:hypothetical protein
MTQETARTMLGLSGGSGVAESRQAYERLKGQLEESLRRAPTSSLQAKYRQRLKEVEKAYSCLQSVATGAEETAWTENLPYLRKIATEQEPAPQSQEGNLPKAVAGRAEPKPRVSPPLIAALIGLLTVGAVAGWWFGAEQPRREAERQRKAGVAEAQRRAEDQQRQKELADAKTKMQEAERQRQEAVANAQALEAKQRVEEEQRQEKLARTASDNVTKEQPWPKSRSVQRILSRTHFFGSTVLQVAERSSQTFVPVLRRCE